jgi:hypothetical protein
VREPAPVELRKPRSWEWRNRGAVVFAWRRGVRWDFTHHDKLADGGYQPSLGSELTVWRWDTNEVATLQAGRSKLWRGERKRDHPLEIAVAFLFDDFANRYALRRDKDQPERGVEAEARASTPGSHLYLSLEAGRVAKVSMLSHEGDREAKLHIALGPPESISAPPLPESCFTVEAPAGDAKRAKSSCPTDRFGE